jgi:hypothetical protein
MKSSLQINSRIVGQHSPQIHGRRNQTQNAMHTTNNIPPGSRQKYSKARQKLENDKHTSQLYINKGKNQQAPRDRTASLEMANAMDLQGDTDH